MKRRFPGCYTIRIKSEDKNGEIHVDYRFRFVTTSKELKEVTSEIQEELLKKGHTDIELATSFSAEYWPF